MDESFFQKYSSRILFSENELKDRQSRMFSSVHEEYMKIVGLKSQINKFKNGQ